MLFQTQTDVRPKWSQQSPKSSIAISGIHARPLMNGMSGTDPSFGASTAPNQARAAGLN